MVDIEVLLGALNGERGDDQQRIAEVGLKWLTTILNKNNDYGCSVWKRPLLAPKSCVADAIFVRMTDKVERIASLRSKGICEVAESLDDTVGDLGAYCLLYLARPKDGPFEVLWEQLLTRPAPAPASSQNHPQGSACD
jgi:hypothetical protein